MAFGHCYEVVISVESEEYKEQKVTVGEKLNALQKRINYLREHLDEAADAFGYIESQEIYSR
jgi:ABC-type nitrate/sulfonate/bicarbonate transport system substrate-binding protein